jgi:hypothetical protein
MKRIIAIFLTVILCFSLACCQREIDAYATLCEFVSAYGAEGVIYSPTVAEGDEGYIRDGLIEKMLIYSGDLPDNYAVFLNSHPGIGSECGVFVCESEEQCRAITEACVERIGLVGGGSERSFVKRAGTTVFYSTLSDRERAERLWREILR